MNIFHASPVACRGVEAERGDGPGIQVRGASTE